MKNWKYTDNTKQVVSWQNESCSINAVEVQEWIAAGNTPLPVDPPSTQQLKDAIQAQIDTLEQKELTPRHTREAELIWAVTEAAKLGLTEPQLYATNYGYARVKDFDAVITSLRLQKDAI